MPRQRPRGLRPDEKELWSRVAETATPLHRPAKPVASPSEEASGKPTPPVRKEPIPSFQIGSKAATSPAALPQPAAPPLRMDKRAFDKMKRGKSKPEGRIDLHGKTADAARAALTAYVLSAAADGKRLILVITGKGRGKDDTGIIPERRGVLRQSLPHWVSTPPLSSVVLQATPAHQRHGGSGAFYLYLRRMR